MRRLSDELLFHMLKVSGQSEIWSPKADVYETQNSLIIKIAVAGLEPEKIELMLSNDNKSLNIKGIRLESEKTCSEKIKYHQLEIYYGLFERNIDLPQSVNIDRDKISAKYKDGMLLVTLTKKDSSEPISIKIEE